MYVKARLEKERAATMLVVLAAPTALEDYEPGGVTALRLRSDAAKRYKRVDRATAVIWKMLTVAEKPWLGAQYVDGLRIQTAGVVAARCYLPYIPIAATSLRWGLAMSSRDW